MALCWLDNTLAAVPPCLLTSSTVQIRPAVQGFRLQIDIYLWLDMLGPLPLRPDLGLLAPQVPELVPLKFRFAPTGTDGRAVSNQNNPLRVLCCLFTGEDNWESFENRITCFLIFLEVHHSLNPLIDPLSVPGSFPRQTLAMNIPPHKWDF